MLKLEWNEFSEHFILKHCFFLVRGLKAYLKTFLGFFKMKYNPLYKRQFLSQIKLDLYQTSTTMFWGYSKIVQCSKIEPIILNSSQEQSTYPSMAHILDILLITLGSWNSECNSRMTNSVDSWCKIWYQSWYTPPKLQSGIIDTLKSMTVFLMHL